MSAFALANLPAIVALVLSIVAYACIAAAESAVVAADKARLRERADRGLDGAAGLLRLLDRPQRLFGAVIVSLAALAGAAMVASIALGRALAGPYGLLAAFVVVPVLLVFGHGVPRRVAVRFADGIAPRAAYLLRALVGALRPILFAVEGAVALADRAAGAPPDERALFEAREQLRASLLLHGEVSPETLEPQQLIHRIVAFHDTVAREAMIPLFHVAAVPDTATVGEALSIARDTGHSRLPVYQGRVDNITGVVICFDLVGLAPGEPITPYVREARYEPETKPLKDLLVTFKRDHLGIVVLVDEYGGAVGIASLEDLIEEIVGEIEDEYDTRERLHERIDANRWRIAGAAEIDALNEEFDWDLPEGDYETLSGFLLVLFGRIPRAGESIEHAGMRFRVLEATPRRIVWVEVETLAAAP